MSQVKLHLEGEAEGAEVDGHEEFQIRSLRSAEVVNGAGNPTPWTHG